VQRHAQHDHAVRSRDGGAFISDRPTWQRAVLLASCVPIAVFSNVLRIVLTGVMQIYIDPSLASARHTWPSPDHDGNRNC